MNFAASVPEALVKRIQESSTVLLAAHIGLDGDHLGSMVALHAALRQMGKRVVAYLPEKVPASYGFMHGLDQLTTRLPRERYDTLITLECPTVKRLPEDVHLDLADFVINFDHHPDNEMYGDLIWVDPEAAALGEMTFDLLVALGVEMDVTMATGLYVAILTDTGSFQYSRVRSATHRRLAHLLEFGLPTDSIARSIYRQSPCAVLKLLGHVLDGVTLSEEKLVAWAEIPVQALTQYGVSSEDTQFFIDDVDRVAGPEVVVLFRELEDGRVKVSLRSRYWPVNLVAAQFGGGGHAKAAGCVVKGALPEVRNRVISAMRQELKKFINLQETVQAPVQA